MEIRLRFHVSVMSKQKQAAFSVHQGCDLSKYYNSYMIDREYTKLENRDLQHLSIEQKLLCNVSSQPFYNIERKPQCYWIPEYQIGFSSKSSKYTPIVRMSLFTFNFKLIYHEIF